MARSVGIPARLATGFVPGTRDALTGQFVVRERDAHAWAEIYFPGVGWQPFDPTASVPLAGDATHERLVAAGGASPRARARIWSRPCSCSLAVGAPDLVARGRRRRARAACELGGAQPRPPRAHRPAGGPGRGRRPRRRVSTRPRWRSYLHDDRLRAVGDTLDADGFSAGGRVAVRARGRGRGAILALTVKGIP